MIGEFFDWLRPGQTEKRNLERSVMRETEKRQALGRIAQSAAVHLDDMQKIYPSAHYAQPHLLAWPSEQFHRAPAQRTPDAESSAIIYTFPQAQVRSSNEDIS
ncbi:MAG TPA: hypothetical protein VFN56_00765 [Candidatus Saccharimonadales bacterium]|nr:hypothetical protein [Candidatus Saccharimonadales bacterium]